MNHRACPKVRKSAWSWLSPLKLDEEAWPELKSDLDKHRLSARKLFNGETGSA
jgi:hypothetical protein